jgi:hypothetical protein
VYGRRRVPLDGSLEVDDPIAYSQPLRSVCWSAGRGVVFVEFQLELAEANSHGVH